MAQVRPLYFRESLIEVCGRLQYTIAENIPIHKTNRLHKFTLAGGFFIDMKILHL